MARQISRREFLKLGGLALGGLALRPARGIFYQQEFPQAEYLGRVVQKTDFYARPDYYSTKLSPVYEDTVVPWLREVVGVWPNRPNQRWVETPDGYLWIRFVQSVRNQPNQPMDSLPETSIGPGMWVQVSVPWVEVYLYNAAPLAPSIKHVIENNRQPRLYYSQIIWVDEISTDDNGQVWYRLKEPYGSYGDIFWGPAEAFHPLSSEGMAPISPGVENKRVEINLNRQTLSCFEDEREVFFCRVSTGQIPFDTPTSDWFRIWRKLVSVHMSGGTTGGGYDLAGIGWTTLFTGEGIAIHSTFWHNNFGERMSHGCVNARPQDALYVFRWTQPTVSYDPGDYTVALNQQGGTIVRVVEE